MGNHQRNWIWGRHAVMESLRAHQWLPDELHLAPEVLDSNILREATRRAQSSGITTHEETAESLTQLCHARDHQGLVARMPEFPYCSLDILDKHPDNSQKFALVLDRIHDPFNFGSILRSADLFGVSTVLIGEREQVGVTSHVARSSAGAVNFLKICRVPNLCEASQRLIDTNYQLIAATEKSSTPPSRIDFQRPTAIVIGNEGTGIDPDLLKLATATCTIPQSGHIDSLNAAVAAGILCYEVARQRTPSDP
ncbi:putative TrmH family tRNA/rRNA methyltransferase [Thalassoglobus neptunius]|uniref:Putative TrmH family tRNA/rRNA methyltransferase n=1 Tax=Thalassoglobus neptunius TaxID=1938619 RepID=A0A5C5X7A3_9PLAN|nr:RNA methyltransferase [Thalassoglobus neptunius]TWT58820.1 putative TrmH family tRNA/rRNA methyltransferase [Thalassoglobus neptunius]